MSQSDFGTINPATKSGTTLASDLNNWRTAVHSAHRGSSRPSYAITGMFWLKDSVTPYELYFYDGTDDILCGTINATTNVFTPAGIGTLIQAYDANTAKLNVAQAWSKAQRGTIVTLTDAATIAVDASLGNNFEVTLTTSRTLGNPSNLVAGQSGNILVTQPAGGGATLSYSSFYKFANATAPVIANGANDKSLLAYYAYTSALIVVGSVLDIG